jgi:hypothetical protein
MSSGAVELEEVLVRLMSKLSRGVCIGAGVMGAPPAEVSRTWLVGCALVVSTG